ncbi:MAG: bacitracin resistance protein BacA [Leptospiraceae bacterium]|nr:bacitracin resistance protein BacA [Leptospiraceae bacterium]MCP5498954.1 bacitracin resistance protein BacA [Leptospiraceae bacterium]
MIQREIYTPPSGLPQVNPLAPEMFQALGEEKIRELVRVFYMHIAKSSIRNMFPEDLLESETKAADFMVQIMGGPSYYMQKNGPARMRMRHFPFEIDEKARRAWLACYKNALSEIEIGEEEKKKIWDFLVSFSSWMVNKK